MDENLQQRISEAMRNPRNMGELANADAIGTVGNSECGEMLRAFFQSRRSSFDK